MTNISALDQQRTEALMAEEKGSKPVIAKSSSKERPGLQSLMAEATRPVQQRSEPVKKVQMKELVERLFHEVRIDGEIYSLDAAPKPKTKLVTAFKDILTEGLDVPGRVTDLKKLIHSVRLVYCGLTTSKVLTNKIEVIGIAVAKACLKSAETVTLLKNECVLAVETLVLTHCLLVKGEEVTAISNFKTLGHISKRMRDASCVISRDLDHAFDVVFEKGNECVRAARNAGDDHAISALPTICAIVQIKRILVNEYQHWRLMCDYCESLLAGDHSVFKRVSNANEKRIGQQWWGSGVFRRNIIQCMSMWVALGEICQVLEYALKEAKTELMMVIKKGPTADEAKKMLPQLMRTFDSDLKQKCEALRGGTVPAEGKTI